jgi:hypothetical protein
MNLPRPRLPPREVLPAQNSINSFAKLQRRIRINRSNVGAAFVVVGGGAEIYSPGEKARWTVANQIPSAVVFGLRAPANILGKVVVFVERR